MKYTNQQLNEVFRLLKKSNSKVNDSHNALIAEIENIFKVVDELQKARALIADNDAACKMITNQISALLDVVKECVEKILSTHTDQTAISTEILNILSNGDSDE